MDRVNPAAHPVKGARIEWTAPDALSPSVFAPGEAGGSGDHSRAHRAVPWCSRGSTPSSVRAPVRTMNRTAGSDARTGCRNALRSPTGQWSSDEVHFHPMDIAGAPLPPGDPHSGLHSPLSTWCIGRSGHRTPGGSTQPAHPRRWRDRAGPHAEGRPPGYCRKRERRWCPAGMPASRGLAGLVGRDMKHPASLDPLAENAVIAVCASRRRRRTRALECRRRGGRDRAGGARRGTVRSRPGGRRAPGGHPRRRAPRTRRTRTGDSRADAAEDPAVLSTGLQRALAAHSLTGHRVHQLGPVLLTVTPPSRPRRRGLGLIRAGDSDPARRE